MTLRALAHECLHLYDLPQFKLPDSGELKIWSKCGVEVGAATLTELSFLVGGEARIIVVDGVVIGIRTTRLNYRDFRARFNRANPSSKTKLPHERFLEGKRPQGKAECATCRKMSHFLYDIGKVMVCPRCYGNRHSELLNGRRTRRAVAEWRGGQRITPEARREVLKRDGHRCAKCGTSEQLTIDHIRSLEMHGSNHPSNLQILCRTCNSSKATTGINFRDNPPSQITQLHENDGFSG